MFNEQLEQQLHRMVYEIEPNDKTRVRKIFSVEKRTSFYFLLLPAILGWILHAPLFYCCKVFAQRFNNSGHYDSVLTSLLLIVYPAYLVLLAIIAFSFFPLLSISTIILSPFTAWACVQAKYQLDL